MSTFYRQIGGINLTRLLGVDEGNHLSLSSTVRYCDSALPPAFCPLQNAFWNGVGMFYGQGFASADDVVGHEMTHGVISHNSDLFYWGQSGAINESLADIMGEIVDHRHPSPGDSPHSWALGEDLPIGAVRNMKDPGRFGQPDTMTSRRYARGEADNGGVHTNSGVGNRTFYLISQGGKQGGQTVRGIDGPSLRKSATLYLDVIQHLVSGSDYADLGAVLDRSCHALARHHTVGMTRADCRNVHRATLATRLRTTPPRAKQPPDAPMTCPKGAGPVRVLFDSEKGAPAQQVRRGFHVAARPEPVTVGVPAGAGQCHLGPQVVVLDRAAGHHGQLPDDASGRAPGRPPGVPVVPAVAPPGLRHDRRRHPGQLRRRHGRGRRRHAWRSAPKPAEGLRWVNGPRDVITDQFGNPAAGRVGFSRDSRGYLASRLTLNAVRRARGVAAVHDEHRQRQHRAGLVPRRHPRLHLRPRAGAEEHPADLRRCDRRDPAHGDDRPLVPVRREAAGPVVRRRSADRRCHRARRTTSRPPTSGSGSPSG